MIKRNQIQVNDTDFIRCPKLKCRGFKPIPVCVLKCVHWQTGTCTTVQLFYGEAGYEQRKKRTRRKNRKADG